MIMNMQAPSLRENMMFGSEIVMLAGGIGVLVGLSNVAFKSVVKLLPNEVGIPKNSTITFDNDLSKIVRSCTVVIKKLLGGMIELGVDTSLSIKGVEKMSESDFKEMVLKQKSFFVEKFDDLIEEKIKSDFRFTCYSAALAVAAMSLFNLMYNEKRIDPRSGIWV